MKASKQGRGTTAVLKPWVFNTTDYVEKLCFRAKTRKLFAIRAKYLVLAGIDQNQAPSLVGELLASGSHCYLTFSGNVFFEKISDLQIAEFFALGGKRSFSTGANKFFRFEKRCLNTRFANKLKARIS